MIWKERVQRILEQAKQQPTEEELAILHRGVLFESLIRSESWKLILDFLEQLDEEALKQVRGSKSTDPVVALALQTRLQERAHVLNELQHFVLGTIEQRNNILKEQNKEEEYGNGNGASAA